MLGVEGKDLIWERLVISKEVVGGVGCDIMKYYTTTSIELDSWW